MIKYYIVNRIPQLTGEHEVHSLDCSRLPLAENQIRLGYFASSRDAVQAARRYFSNVDGCYYCCPESHRSGIGRPPHNINQNIIVMARTVEKARDAGTGKFVTKDYAYSHPKTTVVEKVKVGPTKRRK